MYDVCFCLFSYYFLKQVTPKTTRDCVAFNINASEYEKRDGGIQVGRCMVITYWT